MGVPGSVHERVVGVLSDAAISAPRYIDLGGRDGQLAARISSVVGSEEVYCVDISDTHLARLPTGIRGIRLDLGAEDLPFDDDHFDLVSAVEVVEHLVNGDNLIRNSYRVLKRGGHLILSTPNLASWMNRLLLPMGYQPVHMEPSLEFAVGSLLGVRRKERPFGHVKLFTPRALLELLTSNGFRVKRREGASLGDYGFRAVTYLDRAVFSRFPTLATDLIVLAEK